MEVEDGGVGSACGWGLIIWWLRIGGSVMLEVDMTAAVDMVEVGRGRSWSRESVGLESIYKAVGGVVSMSSVIDERESGRKRG